eukprot:g78196.t1
MTVRSSSHLPTRLAAEPAVVPKPPSVQPQSKPVDIPRGRSVLWHVAAPVPVPRRPHHDTSYATSLQLEHILAFPGFSPRQPNGPVLPIVRGYAQLGSQRCSPSRCCGPLLSLPPVAQQTGTAHAAVPTRPPPAPG